MSSTHSFSSFSTSRGRFLYRSFPSYFKTSISHSQFTILVGRKHAELQNEVVSSRETGNSHHEGDNEPASRVKEQFDRREKSFRRKSRIFERMTQVASTAQAFARIRGSVSTLRKQGLPLLSSLQATLCGHPVLPSFERI